MKYKRGDILIVYKNTPTFKDGAIVQVIDRDPIDKSYSVAELQAIGVCHGDERKIRKEFCKWVKPEDMKPVSLERPKLNIFVRIYRWLKKKIKK